MVSNLPYPEDAPMLERIAELGIAPGRTFNLASFTPDVRKAIEEGVADGVKLMKDTPRGKDVNGWRIALDLGRYGTQYPYRAGWTFYGVGGNLAEDAVYPFGETQADGKPFHGAHKYELHFTQKQIPPVNAFWSVTLYDKDSYLVTNAINRYALGDRSGMKPGQMGPSRSTSRATHPERTRKATGCHRRKQARSSWRCVCTRPKNRSPTAPGPRQVVKTGRLKTAADPQQQPPKKGPAM